MSQQAVQIELPDQLYERIRKVASVAEALSPAGTDNLSVPLITGLVLYLLAL